MAGNNVFNEKDPMDISELASLNDDISPELIEQLQQKLSQDAMNLNSGDINPKFNENDDTTLFEESKSETKLNAKDEITPVENVQEPIQDVVSKTPSESTQTENVNKNFEDNFLKKYKAKLNQQRSIESSDSDTNKNTISSVVFSSETQSDQEKNTEDTISANITERALTPEQKDYNDSLDFLDGNVKYSKYVIYIDPQNVDFINSLTVKERKNLINKILREQDDIAITKHRFKIVQAVIKHAIVAILTIAISIPIIYFTINTSLEASINNYRQSQTIFQTLYKEKGKIQSMR